MAASASELFRTEVIATSVVKSGTVYVGPEEGSFQKLLQVLYANPTLTVRRGSCSTSPHLSTSAFQSTALPLGSIGVRVLGRVRKLSEVANKIVQKVRILGDFEYAQKIDGEFADKS